MYWTFLRFSSRPDLFFSPPHPTRWMIATATSSLTRMIAEPSIGSNRPAAAPVPQPALTILSEATNQLGFPDAANRPNPGSTSEKGGELCRSKISTPYPFYLRGQSRFGAQTFNPINPCGHAHFAQRAAVSRRGFLGMTAAASGLLFGGLAAPSAAEAARKGSSTPEPIPGGIQPLGPGTEIFHINLPAAGFEPSLITDFNGEVGVANVGGDGHADGHKHEHVQETGFRCGCSCGCPCSGKMVSTPTRLRQQYDE